MRSATLATPVTEDEMRRAVEEATRAAKAAQAAAERVERDQPSRFEQILTVLTTFMTTLVDTLFSRFNGAVDNARRSGEEFAARVLRAVSRAAQLLMRAITMLFAAGALLVVGLVVLTAGFITLFNNLLGEPWGTLLVGAGLLILAFAATALARGRLRAIITEAESLAPRFRR